MQKLIRLFFLLMMLVSSVAFATEDTAVKAVDRALEGVPEARKDLREKLISALRAGDSAKQAEVAAEIRAASDVEEKLKLLRKRSKDLEDRLAQKASSSELETKVGTQDFDRVKKEHAAALDSLKKTVGAHGGRIAGLRNLVTKVIKENEGLSVRLDKVEARLGVVEGTVLQIDTSVKEVKAGVVQAQATADRAESKADMALLREDSVEFSSTLGFAARKGIGSAENGLGFGFCGNSKASGFGGCAEVSVGFTGLFGGGQPAPTSAVLEVGPRWTIGSAASPVTAGVRGIIGFASKTRLSDERYAGMSGGVQGDLNFSLAKVSVLPLEVSLRGGQVWGMYEGWVAGINIAIDLAAAGKLL